MSTAAELDDVRLPENPGRGRPSTEYKEKLERFAADLRRADERTAFKMSARGWAYTLENAGEITKDEFEHATTTINKCRKKGLLPLDFTAQDDARAFQHAPDLGTTDPERYLKFHLDRLLTGAGIDASFWREQDHFIQVLVEKVDLREVFAPVCREYSIPIATSKGWSSLYQRGVLAGRFHKWAREGKRPVLLYAGDFDPVGKRISDKLRSNLRDLENARIPVPGTDEYVTGWTPETDDLVIDRFALNHDFIMNHDLTWIDNLETSSGRDLADPSHADHEKEYVQSWLDDYGARKVEANALVTDPEAGRDLFRESVEKYLGQTPEEARADAREARQKEVKRRLSDLGLTAALEAAREDLEVGR